MSTLVLQELKSKIYQNCNRKKVENHKSNILCQDQKYMTRQVSTLNAFLEVGGAISGGTGGPSCIPLRKNILGRIILKIFLKGHHTKKFENPCINQMN